MLLCSEDKYMFCVEQNNKQKMSIFNVDKNNLSSSTANTIIKELNFDNYFEFAENSKVIYYQYQ